MWECFGQRTYTRSKYRSYVLDNLGLLLVLILCYVNISQLVNVKFSIDVVHNALSHLGINF